MDLVAPGFGVGTGMSFDTLAPYYRWMEVVLAGPLLQQCRTRFLDELAMARNVLLLGPGRSQFAHALLMMAPAARVTLVDSSRGMLERLGHDLAARGIGVHRISLIHEDVRRWTPGATRFDAVATHFFLDCFEPAELDLVVRRVAQWTTPDARWLVTDFHMPARGWRRRRAQVIHALMYAFFRAATGISARRLTPPDTLLIRAGFRLARRDVVNYGLLHADLWRREDARL